MVEFTSHGVVLDLNIHEAVEKGVGKVLFASDPYKRLVRRVKSHADSAEIRNVREEFPLLSENAVLALVYYTADVRKFHGRKADNIYVLLNEAMISRDAEAIDVWAPFFTYLEEARRHLPKFSGIYSFTSSFVIFLNFALFHFISAYFISAYFISAYFIWLFYF
jgi:hypothetical protein